MLKNFFATLTAIIIFSLVSSSVVFAGDMYPDTLDNGNLILVDGGMGVGRYADRSSVNVQLYAPPNYQIAIKIIPVTFSDEYFRQHGSYIGSPYKVNYDAEDLMQFKYNWDRKSVSYFQDYNKTWFDWDLNRDYSHAEGNPLIPLAAETAFVTAYNMRFFDNAQHYSPSLKKYYRVVSDDFYRILRI